MTTNEAKLQLQIAAAEAQRVAIERKYAQKAALGALGTGFVLGAFSKQIKAVMKLLPLAPKLAAMGMGVMNMSAAMAQMQAEAEAPCPPEPVSPVAATPPPAEPAVSPPPAAEANRACPP